MSTVSRLSAEVGWRPSSITLASSRSELGPSVGSLRRFPGDYEAAQNGGGGGGRVRIIDSRWEVVIAFNGFLLSL